LTFNDIKVYNSIIEADAFTKVKSQDYIDYASMITTYDVVNKLSQYYTGYLVLFKLYRSQMLNSENNELTKMQSMFFDLLKELQNGEITATGTGGQVINDDSKQGEFFGYGDEGQYREMTDESEFRKNYL